MTTAHQRATRLKRALEIAEATRFIRLHSYAPYPKQREFHAMGATKRERLLMAGNQNGKTYCGGAETAMHLTGLYPDWWEGLRFKHPIVCWCGAITNEDARDIVQTILFGRPGHFGTGMIPADCLVDNTWARGISELIDTARIRHVSGGESLLSFKSYAQGRKRWQGEGVHFVWFDEEPGGDEGEDVYSEGITRTTATGGSAIMTFTPLLGITGVVMKFFPEPNAPHRGLVQMTIDDAEHIPAARRAEEVAKWEPHEREARARGIPMLGSGRVFPVEEASITVDPFEIPSYWPRVVGLDFGWDHPNAAAWCAWNRDTDTFYVYDEQREREQILALHAEAIRAKGAWIPCAWPHDGFKHDQTAGVPIAHQYAKKGVLMLPERSTFPDGSASFEAGIKEMLDRMKLGQWKVFSTCKLWFEEFRIYHRKDGQVVKLRDDLISASRYALMMRRFARTESVRRITNLRAERGYDPLGVLN